MPPLMARRVPPGLAWAEAQAHQRVKLNWALKALPTGLALVCRIGHKSLDDPSRLCGRRLDIEQSWSVRTRLALEVNGVRSEVSARGE